MTNGWNAYIGPQQVQGMAGSLAVQHAIGQRSTANFNVWDGTMSQRFLRQQQVRLVDLATGTIIFTGRVMKANEKLAVNGSVASGGGVVNTNVKAAMVHKIQAADMTVALDNRRINVAYQNRTVGYMVRDLITNYAAAEGLLYGLARNLFSKNFSALLTSADMTSGITNLSSGATLTWRPDLYGPAGGCVAHYTWGSSTFNVFYTPAIADSNSRIAAGNTLTWSVYLRSDNPQSIHAYIQRLSDSTNVDQVTWNVTTQWQRFTISYTLPNPLLGTSYQLRINSGGTNLLGHWLESACWEVEVGSSATAFTLGTIGTVPSTLSGPTIGSVVFGGYPKLSDAFNALCKAASWTSNVDHEGVLWIGAVASNAFGVNPSTIDMEEATANVDDGNPLYRNTQYVIGGVAQTNAQTETQLGDGHKQTFTVGYPLAAAPTSITVNGATQTFAVKQQGTAQWYYALGDQNIVQDPSGTPLANTDTWQINYVGTFPSNIKVSNPSEIATQAARSGVGTGIVEDVITDTTLQNISDAFAEGNAALTTYGGDARALKFRTRTPGLWPNQSGYVTLAVFGFAAQFMVCASVTIAEVAQELRYTVELDEGPIVGTWAAYFQRQQLLAGSYIASLNAGSSSTLAIDEPLSETWTWNESITPTAFVCPLPSTTQYPSTTLFPC